MSDSEFLEFIRLVISGTTAQVSKQLQANPDLAKLASAAGASRQQSKPYFFDSISHYLYAGDTALHIAAAAFRRPIAELLVTHGANFQATNRRGAEPLHYAADANRLANPEHQADTIAYLIGIGANPNALDKSGVAPLHRAVRKRSAAAVKALLDGGANPTQPNKSGSTPLHLAVQATGASGSVSDEARRQQAAIIRLLLERGARPTDQDAGGKTVLKAAISEWIRELLSGKVDWTA